MQIVFDIMRILKKSLDSHGCGYVRLQAEAEDDMYHIFNLAMAGDKMTASTMRNVVHETKTGSVTKNRVRIQLKITIEEVEFDAEQCSLRVRGRNAEENEYVKLGAYHTLTLEVGHPFILQKECWDAIFLQRLHESIDNTSKAELAAVVMQEGLCHVCLVTSFMTQTKARIERKMPKKKDGNDKYEKQVLAFYRDVYEVIRRFVNFDIVKVVLMGSPGFFAEEFMAYMFERAIRTEDNEIHKNKSKFLKVHASSGHKKAIDEMLQKPEIASRMADVKAIKEVAALDRFHRLLGDDEDRVAYGYTETCYANENIAIEELLVTDKLFLGAKSNDNFATRKKFVELTESVKENGGIVHIFSSMHVSGQQLDNYTGCAAILRFPFIQPSKEEQVETGEEDEESDSDDSDGDGEGKFLFSGASGALKDAFDL